jgi:hypothetical protein
MAKLTAAARKKIPAGKFAGPGRSFPINDATHARMAISGATRSQHAGNISASTAARIKAKARKKLGGAKPAHQTLMEGMLK